MSCSELSQEKPAIDIQHYGKILDWADLVVSQSSAITCEAFWYGKKVISTEPCPTWAAGRTTLEDWANPTEPALRAAWHEHIAWCQYTRDQNGILVRSIRSIRTVSGSCGILRPRISIQFYLDFKRANMVCVDCLLVGYKMLYDFKSGTYVVVEFRLSPFSHMCSVLRRAIGCSAQQVSIWCR
jgi:hypothetical protein